MRGGTSGGTRGGTRDGERGGRGGSRAGSSNASTSARMHVIPGGKRWSLYGLGWSGVLALLLIQGCSGGSDTPPPTETPSGTPGGLLDVDGDGYTIESGDCDDQNWSIYTGAPEVPYDGVDQDCDNTDLTDVDGDGFDSTKADGTDCDDESTTTYPGAPEIADGIDNDCNGQVDENVDATDNDNDGYAESAGDCDDDNKAIHPGAEELPYDGIDQDCSGKDETDVDGDGAQGGSNGTDCNDEDPQVKPGMAEVPYDGVDQDCNGSDLVDIDGDGAAGGPDGKDCDDHDPARNPGQTDLPYDGIDQNCDGSDLTDVDEDGQDATLVGGTDCNDKVPSIYAGAVEVAYDGVDQDCSGADLIDVDGDGYASVIVSGGTDCNDQDKSTYPGAPEFADGKDNDCDGVKDEDLDAVDDDKDGYSEATGDCNDANASLHPGATEVPYDGLDQDCSGKDLTDVDGDGVASTAVSGGADCNDNDKSINPNVAEVAYDGIDQDCSGADLVDVDRDGAASVKVSGGTDCNDSDALINPSATEVPYDGIDQNCKDGDLIDVDGDGVASTAVKGGTDCNDANAAISPRASEKCDGLDNDCDGVADDNPTDALTFYTDGDHDGYGDPTKPVAACSLNSTLVTNNLDCDDTNAASHPGASETCDNKDNDCNTKVDDGVGDTYYQDLDADAYGNYAKLVQACSQPTGYVPDPGSLSLLDCNDKNSAIHPGATEFCNSIDDDCDGLVDDGVVTQTYYQDLDSDGYGNTNVTQKSCLAAPTGYVSLGGDCNESSSAVNPGADETCNSVDDDCDGSTDEGVKSTYYQDSDGDSFGNASQSVQACSAPTGYVSNSNDCNDSSASVKPSATETCNGVDDDCDAIVDDGVKTVFYKDADGDSYGAASAPVEACTAPSGYVSNSVDCNDGNAAIKPGAAEACNGVDDDCDTVVDDGAKSTWYRDADGDTYGTASSTTQACTAPTGYVSNSSDCNDSSASVKPGATEVCNAVDDDCDSVVDDGVKITYYRDADGDTYGTASTTTQGCSAPTGYVTNNTDCNDTSASVKPGATETCNGVDDDCDTVIDDGVTSTYYKDADGDGFGVASNSVQACAAPTGYVSSNTDCNDTNAAIKPSATETCNSVDDDCDGVTDDGVAVTYYRDQDSDTFGSPTSTTSGCTKPTGYVTTSTDCDDTKSFVYPGATELCNAIDDDCDTLTDEGVTTTYYRDADGDTYGTASVTVQACTTPTGYVTNSTDCNDSSASVNPAAPEVQNGIDDNCDGVIDTSTSCKALKAATPSATSGTYTIDVDGSGPKAAIKVYCDMVTDGGGWTVAAYIRASSQWDTNVNSDLGTVGDTTSGFASGATLLAANPTFTERVIIYLKLIENGTDLGKQWMSTYRSTGVTYSAISTNTGWSYRDSYNYVDTTVTDTCTHGCTTWRGFGMFHDYESTFGYCGTQTGDYGCRDGNNICWMPRSGGCNVGSTRCSYLTGTGEGVIYAMR